MSWLDLFPHTNEALEAKKKGLEAQCYGSKPDESDGLTRTLTSCSNADKSGYRTQFKSQIYCTYLIHSF